MLNSYIQNTQNLLQNPGAPQTLYSVPNITTYINIARGQIAGESESVRTIGTLVAPIGQRVYPFSSINIGTAAATGIQGVINVRWMMYNVAQGQKWIKEKSWPWFSYQRLNNPVPPKGFPTEWAQFGQGSSGQGSITGVDTGTLASGSLYIDPLPDTVYTLQCDVCCYPQALVSDTDVEALPYFWTDSVPYFAAYLALLSAQTGQRMQQAQQMFALYQQFAARARVFANSPMNRFKHEQSQDPSMAAKYGVSAGGANAQ